MIPTIEKCLNCREKEQRSYSNFCSFECGREYIQKEKDEMREGEDGGS